MYCYTRLGFPYVEVVLQKRMLTPIQVSEKTIACNTAKCTVCIRCRCTSTVNNVILHEYTFINCLTLYYSLIDIAYMSVFIKTTRPIIARRHVGAISAPPCQVGQWICKLGTIMGKQMTAPQRTRTVHRQKQIHSLS